MPRLVPCTTPLGRSLERAQAKLNHLCSSNDAGEVPGNLTRATGSWRPLDRQDGEAAKSSMENSTCQLTAAKARNQAWVAQRWTYWERVKRSLPNPTSARTHRQCPLVAPIQTNRAADSGGALGGQALSKHAQRTTANSGGANAATPGARDLSNASGNESFVGGGNCGSALGTLLLNLVRCGTQRRPCNRRTSDRTRKAQRPRKLRPATRRPTRTAASTRLLARHRTGFTAMRW